MINKLRIISLFPAVLAALLCSTLIPPSAARAGSPMFEEGRLAYSQGDINAALVLWRPLAEQGDADAQFALGTLYYAGLAVPVDYTESSYWFHRAAEQGYAAAQYNLGNAYQRGEGVRANSTMAVHWWRKAAQQGFAAGQYNLASAYHSGDGVERDEERALALYRQSAENGHQPAIDLLARLAEAERYATAGNSGDCAGWLQQQAGGAYTIQLLSTTHPGEARRVANKFGLEGHIICSYEVKGTRYHALLLGAWPDTAAAQQKVETLAPELRARKPWIRPVGSLRRLVNPPEKRE